MKRKTILKLIQTHLVIAASAVAGPASTPTPTPVQINQEVVIEFAQNVADNKNFALAVYPTYAPKLNNGAWGAGIAGLYQINEFSYAGLRMEVLDGNYFAASATVGLKTALTVGGHQVIPTVYGGVISPLSGAGDDNRNIGAIIGVGAQAPIWQSKDETFKVSAFGSIEVWPGVYDLDVQILHIGLMAKYSF